MRSPLDRARPWRTEAPSFDPRASLRLALYALIGILIGLVVAALEFLTIDGALDAVVEAPIWLQALAPGAGLVIATLLLRKRSPSTSDEYVRTFHSGGDLAWRDFLPKLGAAVATLGLGGAAGLEGPSIYGGATIGQRLGARLTWLVGPRGHRILTSAGAAAGVAAVFRAPATGVLFALETPFQRDVARRALIPALIAASAAYLTFVSIFGVDSFLPVASSSPVRLRDEVIGSVVLGVCAGGAARALAWLWYEAKKLGNRLSPVPRLALGSAVGAATLLGARGLTGTSFTLGPGAHAVADVALDPSHGLWIIAGAFVLRAFATAGTLGAGGVGGKFIPLVVQGLLLGRLVEAIFHSPTPGLFPVIGLAAVLGAGYRTPLAAVMFVAETTGRAEFVIPALLATAVSQSLMGDKSVSTYQVTEREGILERRLRLPVQDVLVNVPVLDPDTLITHIIDAYGSSPPAQALPVGKERYLGLLVLRDLAASLFELGPDATVRDAMQEFPAVRVDVPAVEAARLMSELDSGVIPVIDADDRAVGVVTALTMTGVMDYDPES